MLQDSTVSVALQRSIILAVIPPLRHHRTDLLDDIVMLLNAAIAAERSGPAGLVGSHIVGQEMARELPEQAMALVERWAASESAAARRQAARTLSGPLVSHFPDRVAAVRCGLEEQAPTDSRLRAALDAAGRKRMRSERRRRDTLGEDDDAGADAAPVVRR
ncbi:MAG: hypothetical protein NTZ05_09220 [Chloroflexi bacterium]|nr:hypothetical protein [Chloroflexota bacterium]